MLSSLARTYTYRDEKITNGQKIVFMILPFLCLPHRETPNILFVYTFSMPKNKITQPYAQKLRWLLLDNKKVNKIISNLGKVKKCPPNVNWSFCSRLLRWKY